jgi:UDP-N-acetylglucosamine 2-epimerase (non-hydrolysing)
MIRKVLTVVGTRPNIIKITQFEKVIKAYPGIEHRLLHTGQHFSHNMSDVFFTELHLKEPDFLLSLDKTTVVSQLSQMMQGIEQIIAGYQPDLLVVVGDVNSTLAAALTANKMGIRLAHVESGLRSFDRSMPEEINRIITDSLTDIFFVTEQSGIDNLLKEGKPKEQICFVGNTMIDTLVAYDIMIKASPVLGKLQLQAQRYALMTMHRPGNVDTKEGLLEILNIISELRHFSKIVFPLHPRTRNKLKEFGLYQQIEEDANVLLMEPVGYLDFQNLILHASYVITDSGGIQEETTFRQIPCITLRPNTERPSTIEIGSNTLLGFDKRGIIETVEKIYNGTYKNCLIPPYWDGKATERIFEVISQLS